MNNVFRTLLFDKEISCTLVDTTALAQEGIRLHGARGGAAALFGKALSITAFTSACLKEQTGQISLSIQTNGRGGNVSVSGNARLQIRGTIENPQAEGSEGEILGDEGSLTVVREDGYSRPFVGSCAFPEGTDLDGLAEEYYRISEQLPTRIRTQVALDGEGNCLFAGVVALQPLPFAGEESLRNYREASLPDLLARMRREGAEGVAKTLAKGEEIQAASAMYQCNCSRSYLSEVLVTLGEEELRAILKSEGAVRLHCQYCNTDYEFTEKDVDGLFGKHEREKDEKN